MAGSKQIAMVPSMVLAVIEDKRDNCVVESQPTKEELYNLLSTVTEEGDIEGLDYDDVDDLTITIYEVINKPWQVQLGRAKVTITEKTE